MSDQDFFFDEDEQPKKEAAKPAPAAKKGASAPAKTAAPAASGVQSVSMTVTALVGVIALLAGVIIGIVLPVGGGSEPVPTSVTAPTTGAGGSSAPQLTPEQLQGGELPAGHPDIGGSTAATETGK